MIFSLSLMFFLWTGISILSFCSLQSSWCFLKNLSPVQDSHCQSVRLTCETEPRTLDGKERGDSSKGSRYDRGIEEEVKGWERAQVTVETGHEIGFASFYFILNDSREFS